MYRLVIAFFFLVVVQVTPGQSPTPTPSATPMVEVRFVNADITDVARFYAQLSGRKISLQPGLKGKVSVMALHPMPRNQAISFVRDTLMQQGYEVRESGPNETLISHPAQTSLPTPTPTPAFPTPTLTPIKWPPPNP